MKPFAVLFVVVAAFGLSGCTFFQDDVYKLQAGYYASDDFSSVEAAIHDTLAEKFGPEKVFRPDVEWKYNNWTVVTAQYAFGHDKYRTRIMAYPQLDADGMYEPVVVARKEVYTGYSTSGRGGPTAMYSNKWSEAGRDHDLEVELANAVYAKLHGPRNSNAGGN